MAGTTLVTGRRILWNAVHELKIGPYAGGINRYSDVSAIADNEMADCVNFDIDLDGSLKSRPPWRLLYGNGLTPAIPSSTVYNSFQLVLGSYTYNSIRMIFYHSDIANAGAAGCSVYFVDGPSAGTINFIASGTFSKSIRYGDKVYIIPDVKNSNDNGIEYDLTNNTFSTAPLKRGYSCSVYKDRLWISGRRGLTPESRLFFSDPGNMKSFQATSFFDINPGDGDATQDLAVYQDNLIIFKDSATYVLTFDSNPAQAALQVVNTDVGVSGPRCVVSYENSIFILQYNNVYEMVNYDFTRVSVKIPFEYDATLPDQTSGYSWRDPIWLSRIGDRLIARFYNRLYVYHLRLRAWTRWDSQDTNIKYLGYVALIDNTNTGLRLGYNSYVATSSLNAQQDSSNTGPVTDWGSFEKFFILDDRYETKFTENGDVTKVPKDIKCSMITRAFDMGYSHRFKHLMHWGGDVITGRDVTGTALPFAVDHSASWSQLANYQWHQLNTWQVPLFQVPSTVVSQPVGSGINRRFIRFLKALRFRLIQFEIDMITAGNTVDGPARVYSITAFVSARQLASKAVN
jgi:hypothetical protein